MGILEPFTRYLPPGGKGDDDDMMRHRVAKSLLVILPWLGELLSAPFNTQTSFIRYEFFLASDFMLVLWS